MNKILSLNKMKFLNSKKISQSPLNKIINNKYMKINLLLIVKLSKSILYQLIKIPTVQIMTRVNFLQQILNVNCNIGRKISEIPGEPRDDSISQRPLNGLSINLFNSASTSPLPPSTHFLPHFHPLCNPPPMPPTLPRVSLCFRNPNILLWEGGLLNSPPPPPLIAHTSAPSSFLFILFLTPSFHKFNHDY